MRAVDAADLATAPLADVGTVDGVILKGRPVAEPEVSNVGQSEHRVTPSPSKPQNAPTVPEPRMGSATAARGAEDGRSEAERMRAAGFRLTRGAWRR